MGTGRASYRGRGQDRACVGRGVWGVRVGSAGGAHECVRSVSFSGDGSRIVSGSYDNTVRVWDAVSGECVLGPLEGHTDGVKSVSFSGDGSRIVSGSYDNTVRVGRGIWGVCVLWKVP